MGIPNIGELLFGSQSEVDFQTMPTMSPEQMDLFRQLIETLTNSGNLSLNGLDAFSQDADRQVTDVFNRMVRDPLVKDYRDVISPEISRRFSGSGNFFGSGRAEADRTSQQDLMDSLVRGRAGTDLAYRQHGLAASSEQMRLLISALGIQQQENIGVVTPGSTGLIQGVAQGAGQYVGSSVLPGLLG